MNKVKLGIIGVGSMGKMHLFNCLRLKTAEVLSVADSSKKALHIAKNLGINDLQTDYNKILDNKNINAVIIALPNFLHHECAIKAAEAGKDIFLEKPLARNVTEGEKIIAAVRRAGVKMMIGYDSRFNKNLVKLKENIQKGILGDIQIASATNISAGPFSSRGELGRPSPVPSWWFNNKLTGGGALLDLGVHYVNLLRWYFGKVIDVKTYIGYRFNMDFEDHAICFLRYENGTIATINVGWFSKDFRVSVEVFGTLQHDSITITSPGALEIIKDDIRKKYGKVGRFDEDYFKEVTHFVDCVNYDLMPSPSGEEGLLDLKIISRAYKNVFTGKLE